MTEQRTENDLIAEQVRGNFARQIIENPLWTEFFDEMEKALTKRMIDSDNPDYRDDCWRTLKILRRAHKEFEQALLTGRMADIQLAEMQERRDAKKDRKRTH